MPTPSIQTLRNDAQQVLNLDSISAVRSVVAATLANANAGTPLNPNLTTQQLWNEFYQIVTQPKSDIESIIANQLMKFLFAPPAPGGVGANGQVIFNDGGVLAGDPQFLWNKTTNLLTVTGSATITGALTVDTTTLVVNPAGYPDRVGIGTATPANALDVNGGAAFTGFGINANPLNATSTSQRQARFQNTGGDFYLGIEGSTGGGFFSGSTAYAACLYNAANTPLQFFTNGTLRSTIDTSGNSTWYVGGSTAMTLNSTGLGVGTVPANGIKLSSFVTTDGAPATSGTSQTSGSLRIGAVSTTGAMDMGTAGSYSWIQVLDRGNLATNYDLVLQPNGGNLLVGTTSAVAGAVFKVTGAVANGKSFEVFGTGSSANSAFYCPGSGTVNGVATGAGAGGLVVVNKDSGNSRSISAAGTLNASGADYAEYMTKSGDFVIAKGDVAGIDANGKLTNVFADAVSFVVKSTDPSYVGNDKWGVDLEGDALESARQLVDRIAFAGQVPVNVTGAKAGDYIVPVVDGTGIKGIAVASPTFEQYQLAVGKVIAIDADGRARIIVKLA